MAIPLPALLAPAAAALSLALLALALFACRLWCRRRGRGRAALPTTTTSTTEVERFMDLSPDPESPPAEVGGGGGSSSSSASSSVGVGAGANPQTPSLYEARKRRDWNTLGLYLRNHRPPLSLAQCSGAHVLEFLRYLDQFGKTKVHVAACPFFGHPNPPAPCPCPLHQASGSLDALVGRLRAAYEENGGRPESNPFAARAVRLYLREVREHQARARGINYWHLQLPLPPLPPPPPPAAAC